MIPIQFPPAVARLFPLRPFAFSHQLTGAPLLTVGALFEAARELGPEMVEYVIGPSAGLPVQSDDHGGAVLAIIRTIERRSAWMIFRNLEQLDRYNRFMAEVLDDLLSLGCWRDLRFLRPMCFAFLSSPSVLTPLHIDPEHNFLFQIAGHKVVWLNDPTRHLLTTAEEVSAFYADEIAFRLEHRPEYDRGLDPFALDPSSGVYIPVTAPHLVRNGPCVSLSFSLTFRTAASETHRLAHLRRSISKNTDP